MRRIFVAFLGAGLLCMSSGCGDTPNTVERPKNPAPVSKDAKLVRGGGAADNANSPSVAAPPTAKKKP
jgi:hypothetical protein